MRPVFRFVVDRKQTVGTWFVVVVVDSSFRHSFSGLDRMKIDRYLQIFLVCCKNVSVTSSISSFETNLFHLMYNQLVICKIIVLTDVVL